jgi:putative two-component system response regulator
METTSTILIIDDDADSREILRAPLQVQGYHIEIACNGVEGLAQARAHKPDLILLDVMMPEMDGFEVCRRVRHHDVLAEIPIVMITALDDRDSRLTGLRAGADDFITKPFDLTELLTRVQTITRLNRYRHLMNERARFAEQLQRSRDELAQAYDATLEGWVKALDLRDHETEGHSQRVTEMTLRMAERLGIHGEALEHIRRGALLHDIGKMGIPDAILHKQGTLTSEEMAIMRRHPIYAYEWLSPIAYLRPALDIPYCHHEKWDGSGYPRGLKGEEIPLAARIFALADVWDALRSARPYHEPWSDEEARTHIRERAGTHFDPSLVELFLCNLSQHIGPHTR